MNLVHQKCNNSCGVACLSMVTGDDFDFVLDKIGRPDISLQELDRYLKERGFSIQRQEYPDLYADTLNIVVVPSLNEIGATHYIVIKMGETPKNMDVFE